MSHQHPLPDGWAIKPLGAPSLAKINPQYDLTGGPYPFVPMDAVANGFAGIEYFDSVQDASGGYSRFREGDILFAKITPCAENGKLALVKRIDDKLGLGSTEFHVISPAKGVNGQFLYYLFSSGHVHRLAISLMEGTTGRQRIPASIFKKRLSAPVPLDDREQEQIASILYKVDEDIQTTKKTIAKAERLKKALMQNLLTGRLRPDGTWRKEEDFYTDEKFGKVPKGWHWGRLSEIADVIAGQSPPGDSYNEDGKGVPMLNGPTEFTDVYPIPVQFTTKPTKICEVDDILFTVRGSSTGRMNLADQPYCIGRGIAAIRNKENANIDFIYYTLKTIAEKILAEAKGSGTTFPNINRGELLKKMVLIPETEQNKIADKIKSIDKILKSKQIKIQKLERLKKALMQNLLTGKVRVKIEK